MEANVIHLPKEIEEYMEECKAEPGSREWFQAAFHAVGQCATDNAEYLTEEAYASFSNGFEDDDNIQEAIEEMKKQAGLESLC